MHTIHTYSVASAVTTQNVIKYALAICINLFHFFSARDIDRSPGKYDVSELRFLGARFDRDA